MVSSFHPRIGENEELEPFPFPFGPCLAKGSTCKGPLSGLDQDAIYGYILSSVSNWRNPKDGQFPSNSHFPSNKNKEKEGSPPKKDTPIVHP